MGVKSANIQAENSLVTSIYTAFLKFCIVLLGDYMTIHHTKAQIRSFCLTQRHNLTQQIITQASQKIVATLHNLQAYQTAQHIAWYIPVSGEIDLSTLWKLALKENKCCYFPAVQPEHTLIFLPYTHDTVLLANRYHILEPKITKQSARSPQNLDMIILPIVAFDAQCTRLGMGKGYYDKTLARQTNALLVGVAYEWQKQPELPSEPWDIQLDMIITEKQVYLPFTDAF